MKSRTSLTAVAATAIWVALATPAAVAQAGASYAPPGQGQPQTEGAPPPSEGPQGTSQRQPGDQRYDRVVRASIAAEGSGISALSDELPAGSHAEVTAIDTGRTILLAIAGRGEGVIALSPGAAQLLGVEDKSGVRVRRVSATAQDAAALAQGRPAVARADAPQALLAGLRRQLGEVKAAPMSPPLRAAAVATRPPRRPASPSAKPSQASPPPPATRPVTAAPAARGLFIQVAALSNLQNARALATQLGGVVRSVGSVHRVQTGPHVNAAAAQRARADLARRGYGDARIVSIP